MLLKPAVTAIKQKVSTQSHIIASWVRESCVDCMWLEFEMENKRDEKKIEFNLFWNSSTGLRI